MKTSCHIFYPVLIEDLRGFRVHPCQASSETESSSWKGFCFSMIVAHTVIYLVILIVLYPFVFGKHKGYSGKERWIIGRTESSRSTHTNQIDKPHKRILIFRASIKIFFVLAFFIGSSIYRYVFLPEGYTYLTLNRQNWGPIVLMILLISMIGLLIYPFHSKTYLARRFLEKNKKGIGIRTYDVATVAKDFNIMMIMAFYVILLSYPVYIVSLNQYAYFNDDEIVIRDAFDLQDTIIDYRTIERVERTFGSGPFSDRITSMHYVIHDRDDHEINILFPVETDQTLAIHRVLKRKRPELFEPHVMTEEEIEFIESKTTRIEKQIHEIFD